MGVRRYLVPYKSHREPSHRVSEPSVKTLFALGRPARSGGLRARRPETLRHLTEESIYERAPIEDLQVLELFPDTDVFYGNLELI